MRRISASNGYVYFLVVLALHVLGGAGFLTAAARQPELWGLGLLAYTLGLRHAFDADHISAIDNTIRKLIERKRNPLGVGMYFSLGHSTVVFLMVLGIALSMNTFVLDNPKVREIGGLIGTLVSGFFLLFVGLINVFTLMKLWRGARGAANQTGGSSGLSHVHGPKGMFTRLLAPALRMINKSWHMYPLGFLFGLGFDTATEVSLLAISASTANDSVSIIGILSLPLLFAAGMSLMDTVDGAIMTRAYRWAFISDKKKTAYNLIVTGVSVVSAFFIGAVQLVHLIEAKWPQHLQWINRLGIDHVGYALAGFLILIWIVSMFIWRGMRGRQAVDGM
ncbi:HoxN/HupN/NixA family nickel/cobalt transporter [Paenibacillus rhizophilus]|uniref:Nickel/cobalt efflux system n=1 Tax=Paenibacillus rhizophilus TaxID=1850366 RepID=A0A3N9Q7S3_9BACL|nr:HoxN/HupN/NixA family nickel/cobalt transporter [Paenibacillus rhizophilus]RQW13576.1 HoxN/HupN/NixA family nickel/cobalt transporter [Paenibacillus rhizophilus]